MIEKKNLLIQKALRYQSEGKLVQAKDLFLRGLTIHEDGHSLYSLGVLYLRMSEFGKAEHYLARATSFVNNDSMMWANLALSRYYLGRYDEGLYACKKATDINPNNALALNNAGLIFIASSNLPEARKSLLRAVELEPDNKTILFNLSQYYVKASCFADASKVLKRALVVDPQNHDIQLNLIAALRSDGRIEESIVLTKEFITRWSSTLNVSVALDELFRKLVDLSRFPLIYPDQNSLNVTRFDFEVNLASIETLIPSVPANELKKARDILFFLVLRTSLFYLSYQQKVDRDLVTRYARVVRAILPFEDFDTLPQNTCASSKAKKIGVISENFGLHITQWFFETLSRIVSLNSDATFTIFVYCVNTPKNEEFFSSYPFVYRVKYFDISHKTFRNFIKDIRKDSLDFLFFPDVGMSGISRSLSYFRMAANQCVYWGHPVTTGSPNIDFFISGKAMEPDNGNAHYSEQLTLPPGLGICIPCPVKPDGFIRDHLGFPDERFLFISVQSLFKYLPCYDEVYPRIAKERTEVHFVFIESDSDFVTTLFKNRIQRVFEDYDLDSSSYVTFFPRMSHNHFMRLLGSADMCLDSIGWSGGNTSISALAMNCPILTCPTDLMRGRHTYAMLKTLDLDCLIASSVDTYVEKAISYAANRDSLNQLRRDIEQRFPTLFQDTLVVDYWFRFLKNPKIQ